MAKRIMAMAGVVLLVLMYIAVLVISIMAPQLGRGVFFGAIGCTIIIPIVLWIFIRMYDRAHAHDEEQISVSEMRKYSKRIKKGENPDKIADEILKKYNKDTKEN